MSESPALDNSACKVLAERGCLYDWAQVDGQWQYVPIMKWSGPVVRRQTAERPVSYVEFAGAILCLALTDWLDSISE